MEYFSPRCPVTGGNPTRMTCDCFWRHCAEREDEFSPRCLNCETVPAEVEILDGQHLRGEDMAGRNAGQCEICNEPKTVKPVRGKQCCPSCEFLWRAAGLYPQRLVECLQMAGFSAPQAEVNSEENFDIMVLGHVLGLFDCEVHEVTALVTKVIKEKAELSSQVLILQQQIERMDTAIPITQADQSRDSILLDMVLAGLEGQMVSPEVIRSLR